MSKVIILRGCSGSGKSTYTRGVPGDKKVFSADHFFEDGAGVYRFDASKLGEAHGKCLRDYNAAVVAGDPATLIVDNTNPSAVDVAPYASLALAYGRELQVITVLCKPEIAYARNTHAVPLKTVQAQYDRLVRSIGKLMPWWNETVLEV